MRVCMAWLLFLGGCPDQSLLSRDMERKQGSIPVSGGSSCILTRILDLPCVDFFAGWLLNEWFQSFLLEVIFTHLPKAGLRNL